MFTHSLNLAGSGFVSQLLVDLSFDGATQGRQVMGSHFCKRAYLTALASLNSGLNTYIPDATPVFSSTLCQCTNISTHRLRQQENMAIIGDNVAF